MTMARAWPLAGILLLGCSETKVVSGFPEAYAGIGVELTMARGIPQVVRTISGGPASQAGVLPGDRLLAIDGVTTEGLTLGSVVVRLRGVDGSSVTLSLDRKGKRIITVLKRRALTKKGGGYSPERNGQSQ